MTNYYELLFRRQFLLTHQPCASIEKWQHETLASLHIYAHPDFQLTIIKTDNGQTGLALIGYVIDPNNPSLSNKQLLSNLLQHMKSPEDMGEALYDLSGRFVLVMKTTDETCIFHDPCGLRSVYYAIRKGQIYAGSQPWILKKAIDLEDETRRNSYNASNYRNSKIEHWIPGGCSLYKDVHRLLPNHYLRFSSLRQQRFWPTSRLNDQTFEQGLHTVASLLEKLVIAAAKRFSLSVAVTAGWDTRAVLSATKQVAADMFYYTLQYRTLDLESSDIKIPMNLLQALGYPHHVIDCRRADDPAFISMYLDNTPMAHYDDWGKIAFGMLGSYPSDRVAMKGNCSEIGRCFYFKTGKHAPIKSPETILQLERGWDELPFVREAVASWYYKTAPLCEETDFDILDLFYWEQRMGSWQAQSQLEWDIVQEVYAPFNHRGLLEAMLCIPSRYRCAPRYYLYEKICEVLWAETLREPVNPPDNIKESLIQFVERLHVSEPVKHLYYYLR
jgi:hypothetical protein